MRSSRVALAAAIEIVTDELLVTFGSVAGELAIRALVEAVRRADQRLTAVALARICNCSDRTLRRHLRSAGLPTPAATICWAKILVASQLLTDRRWSIESVALELGLPSSAALVHLYRRYAGPTPGEIRNGGGLPFALGILRWQQNRAR
jgi:AraC-like DNA-binding protein